jgi:ABC-2 type transport system permease protein
MKEFEEVLRNKYILTTMASFPLVFSVAIPMIYLLTLPKNVTWADIEMFTGIMPALNDMLPGQAIIYYLVQSNLPFYLMMPAVIPTLISSYSIVGEKKCGTLEPMLATPVSTMDILFGKSLAAAIPSILITWISFLIFMALVDLATAPLFGYYILPDAKWLISLFITAPLLSLASVYMSVLASSRINDIRAAQQVSAVFIIPIMSCFILQLFGIISLDIGIILIISAALLLLDIMLAFAGVMIFNREDILTKWA